MNGNNPLGENIRKYRRMRGLTQAELAEQIFVTAQNVSKWELGKSMPDVENLRRLAEVLRVSADAILETGSDRMQAMVAVDGGGTKSEFALFTADGTVLRRLVLGGSNPNSVGMEQTQRILKAGLDCMLEESVEITAVYAGIAGCSSEENKRKLIQYMKRNFPAFPFEVQSDTLNVIHSAECGDQCIAVICGTGSVVYAKTRTGMHRLGGWGYLFDGAGSGFDLGRDAVTAALAHSDGIGEETQITRKLEEILGGSVFAQIGQLYAMPKEQIASLASVVFEAADRRDSVAERILDRNFSRLAFLVNAAADQFDAGITVVFSGGLTARGDVMEKYLFSRLKPELQPVICAFPQIYGACVCCTERFSGKTEGFRERFESSYRNLTGGEKKC